MKTKSYTITYYTLTIHDHENLTSQVLLTDMRKENLEEVWDKLNFFILENGRGKEMAVTIDALTEEVKDEF